MRRLLAGVCGLLMVLGMSMTATTTSAVEEFKMQFEAKYAKPQGRKRPNPRLVRAIAAAQCRICHPGDDKHKLNAYGAQLGQYVNHFDKDKTERIQDALEKISARRSDPFDPKSPTFGELLKKGELPVEIE